MQGNDGSGKYLIWLSIGVAGVIFLLDVSLPLGFAGGVLYVLVVLIALSIPRRKCVVYFAVLCSVLTILGYFASPAGGEIWKVLANRSTAFFVIWAVALLGLGRRRAEDALKEANDLLEVRVKERTRILFEEVDVRRRTEESLRESEEKYRALLENLPQKVFLKDINSVYISCNERYADDLNIRPDEIIGMTDFDFHPKELADKYRADDKKIMDSGKTEEIEESYIREGKEVIVHTIKTPVLDSSDRVVALHGIFWDITEKKRAEDALKEAHADLEGKVRDRTAELLREVEERKRAGEALKTSLAEKEVLLKEIHHRVKNNLQVIISILNLQSQYIDDPAMKEVFRESQSRIRSMAMIHEKLYQSRDLSKIDFAIYVKNLVASIFSTYKIGGSTVRLSVDVSEVILDIDTCVSLGLIINELCSNALKYAFPEGREGEISIELSPCVDGKCVLTIKDDGIGLPDGFSARETGSMGHQLINSMVAQIRGEMLVSSVDGASFKVTFPCSGDMKE